MFTIGCQSELRTDRRLRTDKRARVAVGGLWYDCMIRDISGGGAFVETEARAPAEAPVALRDDDWGLIAATVTRIHEDGFAVVFGVSERGKRDLIDKLTAYLNAETGA